MVIFDPGDGDADRGAADHGQVESAGGITDTAAFFSGGDIQANLVNTYYSNANSAGLYTTSQIQALNVGSPLLSKDPQTGLFTLTIGVLTSTNLLDFIPFPMTSPQTTINGQGELEFQFPPPGDAAFFRLESR